MTRLMYDAKSKNLKNKIDTSFVNKNNLKYKNTEKLIFHLKTNFSSVSNI